jgi:hypothetical protein
MTLVDELKLNFAETLEARTLKKCSRWAERARYMMVNSVIAPWSFKKHPWLKALHDDNNPEIVICKAAQMGFTEYSINRTLFTLDQLKLNVLYALPNQRPDASKFSQGRLNPAAELSPYIGNLFNRAKAEDFKMTKDGKALYIRGANSRSGFKQIDVALIVLDEIDEMSDEAVGLAEYRSTGQDDGSYVQIIKLSTPHVEETGIDYYYQDSSKQRFFFKCPHCSKRIEFSYPESIVITADSLTDPNIANSYYRCVKCGGRLDHEAKTEFLATGEWVAEHPEFPISGYHINQMYSSAKGGRPETFAKFEIAGRTNLARKTEFYNSSLGKTFAADGAKITDAMLNNCIKDYLNGDGKQAANCRVTMGVDVGQEFHHVWVSGWKFEPGVRDILAAAQGKCLYFHKAKNFEEVEQIMKFWRPFRIVIDAQPEVGQAVSLCTQYKGIANTCYYSLGPKAKSTIEEGKKNEVSIAVNKTYWLDVAFDYIKHQRYEFPRDMTQELREQLKSLVRVYKEDRDGRPEGHYVKKDSAKDHFADAYNYSVIALGRSAGTGPNETY